MERAVPAIMLIAASRLPALRSRILSSAIFWIDALEILATFGVHGDDDGDDKAHIVLRALVELLREGGDVDAVLAQRRADGGRGICLACRDLQLDVTDYFLCHEWHLLL